MLITEGKLQNAIERFLKEADIPRPLNWTREWDIMFINKKIVPAFLIALSEIENVEPCFGFDISKVTPNQTNVFVEWPRSQTAGE